MTRKARRQMMREVTRYLAFMDEARTIQQRVVVHRDGQRTIRYDWRQA